MKINIIFLLLAFLFPLQVNAQTEVSYTYDNLNRLTKVVYGNGVTVTYGYDALGNRTSKKVTGATGNTYTITTSVTPAGSGTVSGGGTYSSGANVELQAIANNGYKFSKWNDGNTDNPRSVTVTSNMNFTAQFIKSSSSDPDTDISQYNNVLYINRTEALSNSDVILSINMKNSVQAEGFQFDLYLPEGVTFVVDADGFPEANLSTERTTTHKTNIFESVIRNDGSLRVFAASTNGSVISGNDGEVCTVKVHVDANVEDGEYPLILKNISISDIQAISHNVDYVKSTLVVNSFLIGDVNGDGHVSSVDITALYNYLLYEDSSNIVNGDVDGDGHINSVDITAIYNILLGLKNNAPRTVDSNDALRARDFIIAHGMTHTIELEFDNSTLYSAFQLDVLMPCGLKIKSIAMGERASCDKADYNELRPGLYRVLASSSNNTSIIDHAGTLLYIEVESDDDFSGYNQINIFNAIFAEPDLTTNLINDISINATGVTSIDGIYTNGSIKTGPVNVFNVNGQLVRQNVDESTATQGLPQGIYIVGNKKIIVK